MPGWFFLSLVWWLWALWPGRHAYGGCSSSWPTYSVSTSQASSSQANNLPSRRIGGFGLDGHSCVCVFLCHFGLMPCMNYHLSLVGGIKTLFKTGFSSGGRRLWGDSVRGEVGRGTGGAWTCLAHCLACHPLLTHMGIIWVFCPYASGDRPSLHPKFSGGTCLPACHLTRHPIHCCCSCYYLI